MRIPRRVVIVTAMMAGTALAATFGYDFYYRSDYYRHRVESKLTHFLGLPVEIAAIRPRGLKSRELQGVHIGLSDGRATILECARVVWDKADPLGPTLHIYDAALVVGTEKWHKGDYAHLWQASLDRTFRNVPARQIRVHHGRIEWPDHQMQHMSADRIDGRILFDERGSAQVRITAEAMNGAPVTPPLAISAQLDPERGAIQFDGTISQLPVDSLAAYLGLPPVGGKAQLTVSRSEITCDQIRSLKMAGEFTGGSLAAVTQACLGRDGAQGQLRLRLNGLIIENNTLKSGDIDIFADPPGSGVGSIDRALLIDVLQQQWGLSIPETFLPPTIDFVNMGVKLLIDDRSVRVLSARTPAGPALITARIFGQNVPLLGDLDQSFPMKSVINLWQQRSAEHARRLSKALPPASAPAPG